MRFAFIILFSVAVAYADNVVDGDGTVAAIQAWENNPTTVDGNVYQVAAGNWNFAGTVTFDENKELIVEGTGPTTVLLNDTNAGMMRVEGAFTKHIIFRDFDVDQGLLTNGVPSSAVFVVVGNGGGTYEIARVNDLGQNMRYFLQRDGNMSGVIHSANIVMDSGDNKIVCYLSEYGIETWGSDASAGDGSWATPLDLGGFSGCYIEDNNFSGIGTGFQNGISDYYGGCRVVWRKNTFTDTNFGSHGTGDGSGVERGPRRVEYYDNTITYTGGSSAQLATNCRGGYFLSLMNTFSNNITKTIAFKQYLFNSIHGKFGASNGLNIFDNNDTTDGAGTPGGAGDGVFESGTTTAGTTNNVVEDTSKSWDADEWENAGYVVNVETQNLIDWPRGTIGGGGIQTSTGNTLTTQSFSNTSDGLPDNARPFSTATDVAFLGSGATQTITRATGSWLDDGFIDGYNLRVVVTSADESANNGKFRTLSVTATVITLDSDPPGSGSAWVAANLTTDSTDINAQVKMVKWGGDNPAWLKAHPFESGQSYTIRRVDLSIDQVGAGQCDMITRALTGQVYNDPPSGNQNTKVADGSDAGSPNFWQEGDRIQIPINQGLEPCYVVGNTHAAGAGASGEEGIIHDYHWFHDTLGFDTPVTFDGATGAGVGTFAQMSAITPTLVNVGFLVTDQGDWDTSDPEADGILYRWDGDSWEVWWDPIDYPHYLRLDGGAPPEPPPVLAPSNVTTAGATTVNVTP